MNREQAKHILDAYVEMECAGGDNKARQSLREVILDAMTSYAASYVSTYPQITLPSATTPVTYKPIVTCGGNDGTVEI